MKNSQIIITKILSLSFIYCLLLGCNEQTKNLPEDKVDEPKGVIVSLKDGKELYDAYSDRRVNLIRSYEDSLGRRAKTGENQGNSSEMQESETNQSESNFVPTRYVEFNYAELKTYLKFIEQEAHGAEVSISNLRVYLTNYPNKDKFEDGKPITEPRRNSVMMVPTTTNGKKDFAFYTADDSEDGQRKAYLLTEELQDTGESTGGKQKTKASLAPDSFLKPAKPPLPPQNQQSLYGNEGGLHPPS